MQESNSGWFLKRWLFCLLFLEIIIYEHIGILSFVCEILQVKYSVLILISKINYFDGLYYDKRRCNSLKLFLVILLFLLIFLTVVLPFSGE